MSEKDEQYMSSKQWLAKYGIEARKLNLYDILAGVAFKHEDGVVEIMEKPPTNEYTDAVSCQLFLFSQQIQFSFIVFGVDGLCYSLFAFYYFQWKWKNTF